MIYRLFVRLGAGFILALASWFGLPAQAAGVPTTFTPEILIDDDSFLAIDSMSVTDIQAFLTSKGGALASFTENGRSAAEIIWGAAHGYGDASGSANGITINAMTGTVSPKVLLVTLQKEQSLITNPSPSQTALDYAMGYGCPDGGGCNPNYRGFTKQVEWAAWQLRYNYERAQGRGFPDYQVGQTMTFSNATSPYNPPPTQAVTIGNRATASLYRYTPHVYNGNYNFWKLYRQWFERFRAELVGRNGNQTIARGGSVMLIAQFKNTGEETWTRPVVRLGTQRERDRIPVFIREDRQGGAPSGWVADNRVELLDAPVAPGAIGTFRFYYTAPDYLPLGTYREYFNLVAENIEWFTDFDLSWDLTVVPTDQGLAADLVSRSANLTIPQGRSGEFVVRLKNTGSLVWRRGEVNLGTDRDRDRIPVFIREDQLSNNPSGWIRDNRVSLVEAAVAPGEVGTFRFWYTVPNYVPVGTYREYFRPVYDGLFWLRDPAFDLSWDITVRPPLSVLARTQWINQNPYPTLTRGESYQFEVKFRNLSTETWQKGELNLGTDREQDRIPVFTRGAGWISPNRVELVEGSVAPGEIGTFRFVMTVPNDLAAGTYREYFRPVLEHITWLEDYGVYWDVTVQ